MSVTTATLLPDPDMALVEARIEAMQVLLKLGWEPERVALAVGISRASWALAEGWMREAELARRGSARRREPAE
jgi:hypothetical protein